MKTWSLIAAVVLSVSLLLSVIGLPPATVSAKDEVKTTVSECTKNCGIKHSNCLKAGKVSAETCKLNLNQCQNEICGKLKAQQAPTPPATGGAKK
jgi:hypothetical protein